MSQVIGVMIKYFGDPAMVMCDGKCNKAWGINSRPRVQLSDDPDDYAFLSDNELDEAPANPGTVEGWDVKPQMPSQRMNRWCVRECERAKMGDVGEVIELHDWSKRQFNMSHRCEPTPADGEKEA